jgi:hypothetical protein
MSLWPDITITGKVSIAVQALIGLLAVVSALAVFFRSKTRPKFFVILGSLLAFASLWLLSLTIAFTVIFATKSAHVSASFHGIPVPQSVINAQAQALGVSPVYKDQSYRELCPILKDAHATYSPQSFTPPFSPGSPGCSRPSQRLLYFRNRVSIRHPLSGARPQTGSRRHPSPNFKRVNFAPSSPLPIILPRLKIVACINRRRSHGRSRITPVGGLSIIHMGAPPLTICTPVIHCPLANADSSVMSSTGSDVLLNFIIVRPLASVVTGSQPSGKRSSSKNGRSVSMSPPKWVNNVEPLKSIVSPAPEGDIPIHSLGAAKHLVAERHGILTVCPA